MNSGTITAAGTGVVNNGTLTMNGGAVTGCGKGVENSGTMDVSGDVRIAGNTNGNLSCRRGSPSPSGRWTARPTSASRRKSRVS